MYVLYSDILELENNTIGTYVFDTAIMLVEYHEDYKNTSRRVQNALDKISNCMNGTLAN